MNLLRYLDPRRSLSTRLIFVNLSVIVLALAAMVLLVGYRLQSSTIQEAGYELEMRTQLIANALREPLHDEWSSDRSDDGESDGEYRAARPTPATGRDLRTLVNSYAADINGRVTVLDNDRRVYYSSDALIPALIDEEGPEIKAAQEGWEQHSIRFDQWTGTERLFVAAAIGGEDSPRGVVQVSVPMTPIVQRVNRLWLILVSAGLALALLALLATLILARQITHPLRALTGAANELAAGDMGVRLDLDRQDEVGALATAFDNMAEQISQLLTRERAFVANASHELRSPLTAIQLRAELLQRSIHGDPARVQRYLAEIERESIQLGRLLERLLDLSRIQAAPDKPAQPTLPAPSLLHVIALFQPLANEVGVTLQTHVPTDLPATWMESDEWELLARNLIDNAIKYTPAGGKVVVEASKHAGNVVLRVQDTGEGIPAADLPHIFERFYQVDKSHRRGGSGLGLSLVQALVARYGGDVAVDSQVGQGATFTVTLPALPDSA